MRLKKNYQAAFAGGKIQTMKILYPMQTGS